MTLRVDLETKEVVASVKALAEREDRLPRPASTHAWARTLLGSRIHTRWREAREREDPAFRGEVDLRHAWDVDGFHVSLRGRADGVSEVDGHLVVDEVKSVEAEGAVLHALGIRDLPEAVRQLRLYALLLAQDGRTIRARLHLVSVMDGSSRDLDVPFEAARVEAFLRRRVGRAVEVAEGEAARAAKRGVWAEGLCFPFDTRRPGQDRLVETIESGLEEGRPVLVEAPTGLGKTVSAMLPALRYAMRRNARLFFLTAKGTQQALVAETFEVLRKASADVGLRALTLRPKAEQCPPGHLICHPEVCDHLRRFLETKPREAALAPLRETAGHVAPTSVRKAADAHKVCPHALTLQLLDQADVVIGDVNYVYDPSVRLGTLLDDPGERGVVSVVDEAHNLFDRAREHDSAFLSIGKLEAYLDAVETLEGDAEPLLFDEGRGALRRDLTRLADALLAHARARDEEAREAFPETLDDTRPLPFEPESWADRGKEAARLLLGWSQLRGRTARGDDAVGEVLFTVMALADLHARAGSETHLPYVKGGKAGGVGVLCLDPAPRLHALHAQYDGTVLMSATLAPLEDQAQRLGLDGLDPSLATMPSPFPIENRGVLVVPDVVTTWRDRKRHFRRIAEHIDTVVGAYEGRYAACFPSYAFLESVREHLDPEAATHFVQTPRMRSSRKRLLDRFRKAKGSSLLLVVMGGVFTEGIDLPGDLLIGAIVVGPALPQIGFERTALRQHLDAKGEDGFASALLYPGLRRVVQAAGRVHRTPEDRGVIVLLGRRFAREPYRTLLPEHWWRYGPDEAVTEEPAEALRRFWA